MYKHALTKFHGDFNGFFECISFDLMHDELKHVEKATAEITVALLATHLWILSEFDNDINTLGHYDRFFAEVEALTDKKINDLDAKTAISAWDLYHRFIKSCLKTYHLMPQN